VYIPRNMPDNRAINMHSLLYIYICVYRLFVFYIYSYKIAEVRFEFNVIRDYIGPIVPELNSIYNVSCIFPVPDLFEILSVVFRDKT
jgi:hypothetical protein